MARDCQTRKAEDSLRATDLIVQHVRRDAEPSTTEATPVCGARGVEQADTGIDLASQVGHAQLVLIPLRLEPVGVARVHPVVVDADE